MPRDPTRPAYVVGLLLLAWALVLLQLVPEYWSMTAVTMHDADDALRLVQVRAFLDGQGWFDLHEARLAPPVGYDSHWSRLIDAGLAGLFVAFNLVVNHDLAERLMMVTWPVLWLLPTIGAAAAIGWRLGGRDAMLIVLLMAVFSLPGMGQFRPGRIDHHNVQIALAVMTVAATVWSDRVRWASAAAGTLTGLALAIGFEGLPILVLCGAAFALRFIVDGAAAPVLRRYGFALAGSALAAFLVSVPPGHWAQIACDALAINTADAVAIGGLGLAASTLYVGATPWGRCAAVGAAGAAAAAMFVGLEPRCIGGPYALMEPALRAIWLSHMAEMQSLLDLMRRGPSAGVGTAAFPLFALAALAFIARSADLRRDFGFVVAGAAFLLAFVITFAVTKIYSYALWLGLPLVAVMALEMFRRFKLHGLVSRFAVALLVTPVTVTAGAMKIALAAGVDRGLGIDSSDRAACTHKGNYAALARLAPGLAVASELEWGPFLLAWTPHAVLSAPYHRLSDTILATHRIFAEPPEAAHAILTAHKATYIVTCGPIGATELGPEQQASSFGGHLQAGAIPAWLEPVLETTGQPIVAYRVKP